jgi:hypothetical protein
MTKQVQEWFGNIAKQDVEVIEDADGRLLTSVPEDIFNVAHIQLTVAKDGLPPELLKEAISACFQSLIEVNILLCFTIYDIRSF